MRATQHPSNNDVLDPPPGSSHEECTPLAITRVEYRAPTEDPAILLIQPAVRSFWQPNEEEKKAIAGGRPIVIEVWGTRHAPLSLGVSSDDKYGLVGGI